MPSSRLFTDLDQLTEGDIFILRVLDETLTYEVDQIHIVEPDDTSLLGIEEGQDLCTLITCTPYGVNSHRLLVRGHRVENQEASSTVSYTHLHNSFAVDPETFDCDYYRFLQGDPAAVNAFQNDYMQSYSWAEIRNAELDFWEYREPERR